MRTNIEITPLLKAPARIRRTVAIAAVAAVATLLGCGPVQSRQQQLDPSPVAPSDPNQKTAPTDIVPPQGQPPSQEAPPSQATPLPPPVPPRPQ